MRCAKLAALAALLTFLLVGCDRGRDGNVQIHVEGQGNAATAVPRLAATAVLVLTAAVDSGAVPATAAAEAATATPTQEPQAMASDIPPPVVPVTETAAANQDWVDPPAGEQFTFDPAAWDQGLAALSSFRQKVVLNFTADDSGMHSKVTYEGDVTVQPSALGSVVRVEGQSAEELPSNQVELIWIDDQVWVKMGRRPWTAVPVSAVESEYGGEVVAVGQLLPFIQQARRVPPDETVNGIPCQHYVYDVSNLPSDAGMTAAQGDIWVARDGGYVVRLTLDGHGTYSGTYSSSGTLQLVYDLYDVNAPITITPPR